MVAVCPALPQNFRIPQAHIVYDRDSGSRNLKWYVDSGAAHHVTVDMSNLNIHENPTHPDQLMIVDRSGLPMDSSSSSILSTSSLNFKLNYILCVPHISLNLLSFPQFTKDNS